MTKKHEVVLAATIDFHAEAYIKLQAIMAGAKLDLEDMKGELVSLCKSQGIMPAGAEKSLRLEGLIYLITSSFGTSSSINEAIVQKVRAYLVEREAPALFNQLFIEKTSYVVAPTAPAVIASLTKSPEDKKLLTLFARVMDTKPKEPSLKVEKKKTKKAAKAK